MDVFDSYVGNGIEGITKLINDVYDMNYLSGRVQLAKILDELMTNEHLSLSELVISNRVHEIADYLSKNQFRLKTNG